jgi:hypothetical protein
MLRPAPKPPRYNRYYFYLAVFGVIFAPAVLSRQMAKTCGRALHDSWPVHRCTAAETWQWLMGGANTEAWILVGLAVTGAIYFVVGVFRD